MTAIKYRLDWNIALLDNKQILSKKVSKYGHKG